MILDSPVFDVHDLCAVKVGWMDVGAFKVGDFLNDAVQCALSMIVFRIRGCE